MKYIIRKKSPGPGGHNEYFDESREPHRKWTRLKSYAIRFDTKEAAESKATELTILTPRYIGRLSVDPAPNE